MDRASRREFLTKCGAGLAGILLARQSPAIITRSLLGANGTEYVPAGGDDFPYVRDGLYAMWDAEWNVGIGEHDPDAQQWIDLTNGGRDWDLDASKCSFSGNLLTITGYCGHGNWEIPFQWVTSEVVASLSPAVSNKNYAVLYQCYGVNDRPRCHCAFGYNKKRVGFNDYWTRGGVWNDVISLHSYSITTGVSYQDGISQESTNFDYNGTPKKGESFLASVYSSSMNNFAFKGTCGCIRIYSRYLSEEEIMHNYRVDAERFGI